MASAIIVGQVGRDTTAYGNEKSKATPASNHFETSKVSDELLEITQSCSAILSNAIAELEKHTLSEKDLYNLLSELIQNMSYREIMPILTALLKTHPIGTYPALFKILSAIHADIRAHTLSNSLLADLSEEDKKICYEFAYYNNHPNFYHPPSMELSPCDYNLNFLWVNLNPQDRTANVAQHIFGNGLNLAENAEEILDPEKLRALEATEETLEGAEKARWTAIKKSFMYRLSKWADTHPGFEINLWYDSALVTEQAANNTFKMLQGIKATREAFLQLRDIRMLPNLPKQVKLSLHPATPVYYRVDLLKAAIADFHMEAEDGFDYSVVIDIDIQPMKPTQLFDQRTLDFLLEEGYVFNRVGSNNFENNFFIFDNNKPELKELHYTNLIQNIDRKLTELRKHPLETSFDKGYIMRSQSIYSAYVRDLLYRLKDQNRQPRKVVCCPSSQFNNGGNFKIDDHQSESFRFIGESNIPFMRNGRSWKHFHEYEGQIPELIDWIAKPLEAPTSDEVETAADTH